MIKRVQASADILSTLYQFHVFQFYFNKHSIFSGDFSMLLLINQLNLSQQFCHSDAQHSEYGNLLSMKRRNEPQQLLNSHEEWNFQLCTKFSF